MVTKKERKSGGVAYFYFLVHQKIRAIDCCFVFVLVLLYGIDLLYSLPSNASLYISATYGFFAGVSAPNSTRRAYTLTTYARAPMKATTTPMLNIQWLGTANISSTNQKCHNSLTPIVNIVAKYPSIVNFKPVFIELFGPLRIGTLLSYIATKPHPNGRATKWLYNHQCAGVNALSRIAVWCNDPSTKLSTSTDAAIEPSIMTII